MDETESREERVYRWTVRTLYVVALSLNAILIWEQVKDAPEVVAARTRVARWKQNVSDRLDAAHRQRVAESWVIWEALNILEDANDANERPE